MFRRPEGCLKAVGNSNLFENVVYMGLYPVGADEKVIGNPATYFNKKQYKLG